MTDPAPTAGRRDGTRSIGIVGGTGPAGRGLGTRLAASGHAVSLGSRDPARAEQVVADIVRTHAGPDARPDVNLDMYGCSNDDAARSEIVVIATPWEAAATNAAALADRLDHTLVISMANAVAISGDEFVALYPSRGSVAAEVQAAAPRARVAAAFHHLPARELGQIDQPMDADVLVCADRKDAQDETLALIASIPGLRPVACGSLANAGPVESFTAVLLTLNKRHRTRTSIRIDHLPGHTVPGTV